MKKLFAVLVALTLVLSMGTIALATDGDTVTQTGSITITNASKDAKYDLYRIFDLVSYDAAKGTYSYKLSENWKDFTNAAFVVNENGYIEWVVDTTDNGDAVNAFVKDAIAYAQNEDNNISADADATATADGSLTIDNLPLGYYLIDTSLGTLCSITTTNPNAEVTEKNEKPDIDKFVQEDSKSANNTNDQGWGKVNDADIDQVVYYKSTITVGVGATNYVMHDTMEAGLTFDADSVVVKLADGTPVDADNYTVTVSPADGHTFDVAFNNDFIAGLGKGDTFTVYYSATLNENAEIAYDGPNVNEVYLSYGEDSTWETGKHFTSTYTWKMDVLKYAGTDKTPLAGAKFQLLGADGNAIKFSKNGNTYKVDAEGTVTEIETDATGKFELVGLDEGSYKLHETVAPAGYNKLAADLDVVITSEYDETALTATYEINDETPATIEVENKTGSLLPETGGIGTTIFYVVGGILMLAALVLLVSKKRMANFA